MCGWRLPVRASRESTKFRNDDSCERNSDEDFISALYRLYSSPTANVEVELRVSRRETDIHWQDSELSRQIRQGLAFAFVIIIIGL
jgi:hypothetical protein